MKKLILTLAIILVLTSGCSSKTQSLNISEWMFNNSLKVSDVEQKIGTANRKTDVTAEYDNWEICNGISGTLTFEDSDEKGWVPMSVWRFTTTINNDDYELIHKLLKEKYEEQDSSHQYKIDNGTECSFDTTYKTPDNEKNSFTIQLYLSDENLMIIHWGDGFLYGH